MYAIRVVGGLMYFSGLVLMVYNLLKTARAGRFIANEPAEAAPRVKLAALHTDHWHRWIERRPVQMLVASLVLVGIGGAIEIFPMLWIDENVPKIETVKPYTPLELQGRDIYIREGCVGCHSQMIRPFRSETERYGEYSKSGEFVYDRPFLWGSKRTGPDLHRVGGKYPDSWHYHHMLDPTLMSPGSIMPVYPWLHTNDLDNSTLGKKIQVLRDQLGTPYQKRYEEIALQDLQLQAEQIAGRLRVDGIKQEGLEQKEIVALIAYLQRLGTDIGKTATAAGEQ
jgi:cytochrome c oxidase cbb3-type subunit I/II